DVEVVAARRDRPRLEVDLHRADLGAVDAGAPDPRSGRHRGHVLPGEPGPLPALPHVLEAERRAGRERQRERGPEDLTGPLALAAVGDHLLLRGTRAAGSA